MIRSSPSAASRRKGGARVEHALSARRPRARYLVGLDAKVQARLKPFVPTRAFDRVVARMMGCLGTSNAREPRALHLY